MKAAIYARISTDNQDSDNQVHQLAEYCHRQGWTYDLYMDQASGSRSDRREFNQMLEDARLKKFDIVVFWALDRFSREGVLATLNYLERLTSYGVAWRSYTESYLDSLGVFREAIISIMATLAKQERVRISERTKAGLERARRSGKSIGRPKRIVDRQEIRQLVSQGYSRRSIARRLGTSASFIQREIHANTAT